MASIFLRGNIWYIQTCENGKTRQKSLRTKDKKVAQYRKNEIENKISRGDTPISEARKTVLESFEEFKKSRDGILAKKTVRVVNQRIQAFLDDTRIVTLSQISEDLVKDHLDRRIKGTKESPGISHKTANHSIQQIGTFLSFCVRRKYLKENPLRWMKRYRLDPFIPRFLTHNEAQALLTAAKPTKVHDIITIALYTGMRWGEIDRLCWEDFDLDRNEVIVRKSKTNKYRIIPIAEALRSGIDTRRKKGKCSSLTYDQMDAELTKIRQTINIPHFRFHDLRHTFASIAIKSGVDLLTLSKWLGHSAVRTTELYAHLYDDHSQSSMKKFAI